MSPKSPTERRVAPFSNIENSEWGRRVDDRISDLEKKTEERHKENTKNIRELQAWAMANREAISENTQVTKNIHSTLEELAPIIKGMRGAKQAGRFAWASALVASKVGRWLAGLVGIVTAIGYLLHEKWIDAWKALLRLFTE